MSDPGSHLEYLRASRAEHCRRCALHRNRSHLVFGDGNPDADIMIVGEAPGQDENREGIPFIGQAGKILDGLLRRVGLIRELDGPIYICNTVKCWPGYGNPDPLREQIIACSPYLRMQLRIVRPKVIVTLGRIAGTSLTGHGLDESVGYLRNHDWMYEDPSTGISVPLVATYHPSYILRNLTDDPKTAKEAALKVQVDLERASRIAFP